MLLEDLRVEDFARDKLFDVHALVDHEDEGFVKAVSESYLFGEDDEALYKSLDAQNRVLLEGSINGVVACYVRLVRVDLKLLGNAGCDLGSQVSVIVGLGSFF